MIEIFYIAYLKKDPHWGVGAFKKFIASYEKYGAGIEHKLTILMRGFEDNLEDYNKIKNICGNKNIACLDTIDTGFDFGAYLEGAVQSDADYICCLNTSCEIMCDDWLKKLYSPIEQDKKYKMTGSRGGWDLCASYIRDYRSVKTKKEKIKIFFQRINLPRYLFRYLFSRFRKGFPNYAIGTSCFLIEKNLYLEYFKADKLPENKMEAYKIENGEHSLSKFVLEKGFDFCVVDRYGVKFDKEDFYKSRTFRASNEKYIIKDRQQENYENYNFLCRTYLRSITWGKFL